MFIGLDVGGTHTDGVLLNKEGQVVRVSKVKTRSHLHTSILETLDNLAIDNNDEIERIVFSTTLTTNLIAQHQYPPTGLALIPGPGIRPDWLKIGQINHLLDGSIDHRGRKITSLDEKQVEELVKDLVSNKVNDLAIIGKFSTRNPLLEENLQEIIEKSTNITNIQLGNMIAPRLNFPRRVHTTWLNTAVYHKNQTFLSGIKEAIRERGIHARLYLLKADGGTLPLEEGQKRGVETIKSGPAASIMGFLALASTEKRTSLLLDVGGTTTDLALMTNSHPLFEPDGVTIDEYITSIRGLLNRSIPYGGDSRIIIEDGQAKLAPERVGPAVAFGGQEPTLTDALVIIEEMEVDQKEKAIQAIEKLSNELDITSLNLARQVVNYFYSTIREYVSKIIEELNSQPVYTIHELLEDTQIEPEVVMMIGGPAQQLLPGLARELELEPILLPYHHVANALGAALARPTLSHSLYADTSQNYYRLSGVEGKEKINGSFTMEEARQILIDYIKSLIEENDKLKIDQNQIQITHQESFNLVRNFSTQGQIIKLEGQIQPGINYQLATIPKSEVIR